MVSFANSASCAYITLRIEVVPLPDRDGVKSWYQPLISEKGNYTGLTMRDFAIFYEREDETSCPSEAW